MQLRDWPLRKRLLFSNFIMIFIPVLFTGIVSIFILLGLQFGNINRTGIISFIWPESGQNMSIQFELSRLRVRADRYDGNLAPLLLVADHLEDQGLNVSIWKDGQDLYDTAGIDGDYLRSQVTDGEPRGHASFSWTGKGLRFYYVSPHTDVHLAVSGAVPLYPESEFIDLSSKEILKLAFYVLAVLAILLTVAVASPCRVGWPARSSSPSNACGTWPMPSVRVIWTIPCRSCPAMKSAIRAGLLNRCGSSSARLGTRGKNTIRTARNS